MTLTGGSSSFGSMQDHLARRRRASALDEAQMALRDLGFAGEIELAEPAPLTPVAQEIADGLCCCVD
jgi:hypothetical protein